MKTIFLILFSAVTALASDGVSHYTRNEISIRFDGEILHTTISSHLIIFDDANPRDYSLQMIAVPHQGELKNALIEVTPKNSKPRSYGKKDAVLVNAKSGYELVSDAVFYGWDLQKIEPGSEIDCLFEIDDQDAFGGKFCPVPERLSIDTAIINISFPANRWRLKYSVDHNNPAYTDSAQNVSFVWHNLQRVDSFDDRPRDFLPGLWYLFESKSGEADISDWQDVYLWCEKRLGSDLAFKDPARMTAISTNPAQIISLIFKQCHYVAVELGKGWYEPTASDEVWNNGYGDCKGLATLFVNWMKAAGYEAWPVLVRSSQSFYGCEDFPSPFVFDHMIAAYALSPGDTQYQDLTAEYCPSGFLPRPLYGCLAFPVLPNASPLRLGTLPKAPDTVAIQIMGEMAQDGTLIATMDFDIKGEAALLWNYRDQRSRGTDREAAARSFLEPILPSAAIGRITENLGESEVHLSSDIKIARFSLKRDGLVTFKPWKFNFLNEKIKSDSARFWPTVLRQNTLYLVAYRIQLFEPVRPLSPMNQAGEYKEFSYSLSNRSHDDSLIVDLSLWHIPAILSPEELVKYQDNRKNLMRTLENEVTFLQNK